MATVKELGNNKVEISFEISTEQMQEASSQAYLKNRGRYAVPGFRKGRAPKAVLERYYGETLFFEEAFDIAFPDAYSEVIDELELFVVSRPENLNIVSMEPDSPIELTVEAYVKPQVELGEYKGIEVEFAPTEFDEAAVAQEIESALERSARYVDVARAAQDGDRVILDYSGSVDGVKFDGGTAEKQTLDLGSNTFIPGFEEQVVGMEVGENKDLEVTFPEEYHAEELAGKAAVFNVTVHEIKEKELPEANDEFAQDVSEFDTFDEYKADIENKLKERNEQQNKNRLESLVVEKIVNAVSLEIPDAMVDSQIDSQMQEMMYNLAYQGMSMDQYLEYTGMTMEAMREQMRDAATERVKTQLVLEAIKEKEGITAEEEAIDKSIAEFAEMQNKTFEDYKKDIDSEELEYITNRAAYEALGNFLVAEAKIVEPKEDKAQEEKPKKKAAPKKKTAKKEVKEDAPKGDATEEE